LGAICDYTKQNFGTTTEQTRYAISQKLNYGNKIFDDSSDSDSSDSSFVSVDFDDSGNSNDDDSENSNDDDSENSGDDDSENSNDD